MPAIIGMDLTTFPVPHTWMHRNIKIFKWLHMEHHSAKDDLTSVSALRFHPLDLIIENSIAPFIVLSLKWILGYHPLTMHGSTFFWVLRGGINAHSCNKYSDVCMTPIYDQICSTTVMHNLHHVKPNEYFTTLEFHMLDPKLRARDYDLHDKLLPLSEEFQYERIMKPDNVERRSE